MSISLAVFFLEDSFLVYYVRNRWQEPQILLAENDGICQRSLLHDFFRSRFHLCKKGITYMGKIDRNCSDVTDFESVICFGGEDWWYHNRGHIDMQLMRRFGKMRLGRRATKQ